MNEHQRTKDRENWNRSVGVRRELIDKAEQLGLLLINPHNMKIKELTELVHTAERWRRR